MEFFIKEMYPYGGGFPVRDFLLSTYNSYYYFNEVIDSFWPIDDRFIVIYDINRQYVHVLEPDDFEEFYDCEELHISGTIYQSTLDKFPDVNKIVFNFCIIKEYLYSENTEIEYVGCCGKLPSPDE